MINKRKKYKKNSLQDLIQKYPDYIIAIKAGCFYNLYYESARIISEFFGYKTYIDHNKNFSRITTGFPEQSLGYVIEELRLRNIKFVIVKDYEIIDINNDGEGITDSFENNYNEDYLAKNQCYIVTDVQSGIVEEIKANSIFGQYFVNKKIGDKVKFFLQDNHMMLELEIKDILVK